MQAAKCVISKTTTAMITRYLLLVLLSCSTRNLYCQQTDSLVLYYPVNEFALSKTQQAALDQFLQKQWDRIAINGFTDNTDEEDYNMALSKRRAATVQAFCVQRKVPDSIILTRYFGEAFPANENESETGRAENRRTVLYGFRYPRMQPKAPAGPPVPVTRTLDNGMMITYRPGTIPAHLAAMFDEGYGGLFQFVTNTREMERANLYNNTTRGEILSSVMIFCGERLQPCQLDTPVIVRVPIPFKTKCPIEKVKFFNAVAENGKRIWQEDSKELYPETINGIQYIKLAMDNFCTCINFDFKVDPECFPTDSTRVYYVNKSVRNMTVELKGYNSLYMPRKENDSVASILYIRDNLEDAQLQFSIYKGKRRVRSFREQQLATFPFDPVNNYYVVETGSQQFYFGKLKVFGVHMRVNGDKYWAVPDEGFYDFTYCRKRTEDIRLEFWLEGRRGRAELFRNIAISSLPYDPVTKRYIINRNSLSALRAQQNLALTK